ncbi:MAG TPA: glyoxalase superfamily protein [Candidatus Limnocylindrales bacterium]|jgi:uncharacterized glyoxalase superfamily protein PhnB|nr:glyoxalase superfamily protein [Candidatus Limnocylindrales bacterium]
MTEPNVFPSFRYRDAAGAIAWLVDVLGFEVRAVHEAADGSVAHAELSHGSGLIMLGTDRDDAFGGRVGGGFTYIAVEGVDGLYERAVAKGADVLKEITDTDYGSRDFSVRDPEGNVWSFGTYLPSVSG